MTAKQLDRLLEKTVAEALGVELPARRNRRPARHVEGRSAKRANDTTARHRELEPA